MTQEIEASPDLQVRCSTIKLRSLHYKILGRDGRPGIPGHDGKPGLQGKYVPCINHDVCKHFLYRR